MNVISNKGLKVIVGCAIASLTFGTMAQATETHLEPPLTGTWHCHFLNSKTSIEGEYYSAWTFNDQKHQVDIFYSPVHKGLTMSYRWQGETLALGDAFGPFKPVYGTYPIQRQSATELIIEDPKLPWRGWRCQPSSGQAWPADGLQFLDYGRYPWLAHLIEDGPSITKYRNPSQYQEWLHSLEGKK